MNSIIQAKIKLFKSQINDLKYMGNSEESLKQSPLPLNLVNLNYKMRILLVGLEGILTSQNEVTKMEEDNSKAHVLANNRKVCTTHLYVVEFLNEVQVYYNFLIYTSLPEVTAKFLLREIQRNFKGTLITHIFSNEDPQSDIQKATQY